MEYMRTLRIHMWDVYRARIATRPRTPIAPLPTVAMGAAAPELDVGAAEPESEPEVDSELPESESEVDSELSEPPVEVEEVLVLTLVTMEPEASVL